VERLLRVAGLRETIADLLQFFGFGFYLAFANEGRSRSIIKVIRGRTFPQHPLGQVQGRWLLGLFRKSTSTPSLTMLHHE